MVPRLASAKMPWAEVDAFILTFTYEQMVSDTFHDVFLVINQY